jgi:hypothetical protein
VRALFGAYDGPLYSIRRASDNTTADVAPLAAGSYANSSAQDAFCAETDCVIQRIFDQTANSNHLDTAPGGGHVHTPDVGVNASADRLTVGGHAVYSAYFEGGMGYRIDNTTGVATGNEAETMYMVTSGRWSYPLSLLQ